LFVRISQVINCVDRLRNDLYCVGWGVKLYSTNHQVLLKYFSDKDGLAPEKKICWSTCVL